MRIWTIVLLLALATPAAAARIVSDNATEAVESCVFEGITLPCVMNAHGGVDVTADSLMDAPGAYTVRAKYCIQGGLWCSDWSDPLAFSVPSKPSRRPIRMSK